MYILLLGIFCFFLSTGFFLIEEGERGILFRFGKIVKNKDKNILLFTPGLHYKLPLIESVKKINSKIQTTENRLHIFIDQEKKDLTIDCSIQWKINDFGRYYLSTRNNHFYKIELALKQKLENILFSTVNKLNQNTSIEKKINLLNKKIYEKFNFYSFGLKDPVQKSSFLNKKNTILTNKNIREDSFSLKQLINSSDIENLGVQVVDISIKKITLSILILNEIYHHMQLENEFIARNEILKGKLIAKKIKSKADYAAIKILLDANIKGLIIKGEGEAISLKLLSSFFIKDPNFYRFLRKLQVYEKIFNTGKNFIIIRSDNIFKTYER
ncbi:protease modulator HflC [Buchnera aphidicola]|uniref:protease modulator HflC n=1 Tax=Buchnera aphidicola TaxID=9 RepID=UPI003463C161